MEGSLCCIKFGINTPNNVRLAWVMALDAWTPTTWGPDHLNVSWKVNKSTPGRLHGITPTGIHIVTPGRNVQVRVTHWQSVQRVDVRVMTREPPSLLVHPLDAA